MNSFIIISKFIKVYYRNLAFKDILFLLGVYFFKKTNYLTYYLIFTFTIIFINHIRFYSSYSKMILLSKFLEYDKPVIFPILHFSIDVLIALLILIIINPSLIYPTIAVLFTSLIINILRTLL